MRACAPQHHQLQQHAATRVSSSKAAHQSTHIHPPIPPIPSLLQAYFEGGANDADLCRESVEFPRDAQGRPTYRPSAGWFLSKVDFNNALAYEIVEQTIKKDGDDLTVTERAFERARLCSLAPL